MIAVTGLGHVYLTVSDFAAAERFYDGALGALGFAKLVEPIGGDPHAHYQHATMQLSIRPARTATRHDPYAPGLHHLCLRLADRAAVDAAARALTALGVTVSAPREYPEYAASYYALFFEDPDGIRLELMSR